MNTPVKLKKGVSVRVGGTEYVGVIPAHLCPPNLRPPRKPTPDKSNK